jgi:hypothetical protein
MLQLLGIPGHDKIGEQRQLARHCTLLLTAASALRVNGIGLNGSLELMH